MNPLSSPNSIRRRDPEPGKGWARIVHTLTSENYLALTQSVKKAKALAKPGKKKGSQP